MITIRLLNAQDVEAYRTMRLASLREVPEAFGVSYEEEAALTLEQFAKKLTNPAGEMFGAFTGETLVGIVGVISQQRLKSQHRAMMVQMYVSPALRGQQVGQRLVEAAIAAARQMSGIEALELTVTFGNGAAERLYNKCGFVPYAIDPNALKIEGRYYHLVRMMYQIKGNS